MAQVSNKLSFMAEQLASRNPSAMVSLMDPAGIIHYTSPSCQPILGYTSEERVGQNAASFVCPSDVNHAVIALEDALLTGRSVEFGARMIAKSGSILQVRSTGYAVTEPDTGDVLIMFMTFPVT